MSPYEYFMVTLSILLGLALGSLVSRAFGLLKRRDEVRFHWVPALWAVSVFGVIVQFCFVGWLINGFAFWGLAVFLLMLATLIALYGAAELILPSSEEPVLDLHAHFERHGRLALGCLAAYAVLMIPVNVFVLGNSFSPFPEEGVTRFQAKAMVAHVMDRTADQSLIVIEAPLSAEETSHHLSQLTEIGLEHPATASHDQLQGRRILLRRPHEANPHFDFMPDTAFGYWAPTDLLEATGLPIAGLVIVLWGLRARSPRNQVAAVGTFMALLLAVLGAQLLIVP